MRKSIAIAMLTCLFVGCKQQSTSKGIRIDRLDPDHTTQGKAFNVQPDGQSALAITGVDIPKGSAVLWNDQALMTVGGGSLGWTAATIPTKLYATPGTAKITVRGPDGGVTSNMLEFTVFAQSGPPPAITELYPGGAVAGKGFNLQPGGGSALAV